MTSIARMIAPFLRAHARFRPGAGRGEYVARVTLRDATGNV
jgi:hypothetical protein